MPTSYGGVDVTLIETVPLANYTIRTFGIIKVSEILVYILCSQSLYLSLSQGGLPKNMREVKQFHFTTWPDHGVPEFPTAMLAMIRCVRAHHDMQLDTGPMVVYTAVPV